MVRSDADPPALPDNALVALDSAVEILDVQVKQCSFLCQTALDVGMVVPPGKGLLDFVRSLLGSPTPMGDLRDACDDPALVDEIVASLLTHGFACATSTDGPVRGRRPLRRVVELDLDAGLTVGNLCTHWRAGDTAAEVLLRCRRTSDHIATLEELATRREGGELRAHHVVIRAFDVHAGDAAIQAVSRLGAAVQVDAVDWPAPAEAPRGLADLAHAGVPTHVIMAPDRSILAGAVRKRCIQWLSDEFISGLCLRVDPVRLAEDEHGPLFDAVLDLEQALGDVEVLDLPADEVILGNTERRGGDDSDLARRFRRAYLRTRIPQLRQLEADYSWSQVPEEEDRWVRIADDLLPNRPELLGLVPGSTIVDVCGGLGRVARRLLPAVGPRGSIISIEQRRFVTERARRYAYDANITNIQFRPGLAQRLPLPDRSVDAAVNEWTGAIWELGLGPSMISEMARVVRPGGRVAVTHRLVQLGLDELEKPWVQYEHIARWMREAFTHPALALVSEHIWGQIVPPSHGLNATDWVEHYLPRLVNPDSWTYPEAPDDEASRFADVYLTIIAERNRL